MANSATKVGRIGIAPFAKAFATDSAGQVKVAFGGLFSAAPVVAATGISGSDGRAIVVSVVAGSLTKDGVTLQAYRSVAMPVTATLSQLLGSDLLPPAGANVGVHVHAAPASA